MKLWVIARHELGYCLILLLSPLSDFVCNLCFRRFQGLCISYRTAKKVSAPQCYYNTMKGGFKVCLVLCLSVDTYDANHHELLRETYQSESRQYSICDSTTFLRYIVLCYRSSKDVVIFSAQITTPWDLENLKPESQSTFRWRTWSYSTEVNQQFKRSPRMIPIEIDDFKSSQSGPLAHERH